MVNREGKNLQNEMSMMQKQSIPREANNVSPYFDLAIEETRRRKFEQVKMAN
jgi:hypothetical protein